ncbi:MAG: protease inhibitor I9 family protein [Gemmatimonadota bacterium]
MLAITGINPRFVYTAALNGFAATLNAGQLNALQHNRAVDYIEADQEVTLDATQSVTAGGGLWGLDRTDQRNLPLSGTYTYKSDGQCGSSVCDRHRHQNIAFTVRWPGLESV